ncbi:MAG: tyrosine-type recombinase/integrase, partial [Planctomycetota bacterium]
MATIYQRNEGGSWYIDWREDGRRKQVSLKTKDRRIAERELKRLEARLALGVADLPTTSVSEIRLKEFAESYLLHLGPRASKSYQRSVQRAFDRLGQALGNPRLSRIHTRELEAHITALADVLATATVNLHLKIIRAGFNQAIRWGHLVAEPTKGIKFLKDPSKDGKVEFLSEAEVDRLLDLTSGEPLHDIFATLFFTGLRRGELVHLWWEDVDFEQGMIHVRIKDWVDEDGDEKHWSPKGRRERAIPMHPKLRPILQRQPRRGRSVFTTTNGRSVHRTLNSMVSRFQGRSGWRVTCHLLRHTFASHLVQKGVSLYVVGELLGHSGPEV